MNTHRSYLQTLSDYASLSCESLRKEIAKSLKKSALKIVVLDDDPTGIQIVHDCLLLTNWKAENLEKAFNDEAPIFYVLTNTRSMTAEVAEKTTADAVEAIVECNRKQGFKLLFISRGDSALRGHFPLEPDTIRQVLEQDQFPVLASTYFIPSFFEAGRYTIDGTQYLKDKDILIPVSETEFAADTVFGYHHSKLSEYITEKTLGRVDDGQIGRITLEELRRNSIQEILTSLKRQSGKLWIIVDALSYDDLWKFSTALLKLMAETDTYALLRTSSSLPKALSGMTDKELLNREDLISKKGKGLFIVGSHIKKSSNQLAELLKSKSIKGIEVDVKRILESPNDLAISILKELKATKLTPVLYTSREELRPENASERLLTNKKISDFLVSIVRELPFEPSFIVAKGGITSHDILCKGLTIETATVAGQILPGVPVVKTAADHRFPNMPYIIFPGNVGETDALVKVLENLV
jgi:uncharacterized protein YgbK (DUF1537 family)